MSKNSKTIKTMDQLTTPTGISKKIDANTVVLTWDIGKYNATSPFGYQFVKKGSPGVILIPTAEQTGVVADSGTTSLTVTFTFADDATASTYADYIAEVQATDATTPDNDSAWGIERYWVVAPTLTITIGGESFTLTKDTFSTNGGLYKLPASETNPITILYTDLVKFVETLPGGLTLPTEYPNRDKIGASLNIYELVVDTTNGLFNLSISVILDWSVIPLLTINRLGLVLKRTDGSL
jgi:hypothetical protein